MTASGTDKKLDRLPTQDVVLIITMLTLTYGRLRHDSGITCNEMTDFRDFVVPIGIGRKASEMPELGLTDVQMPGRKRGKQLRTHGVENPV